MSEYKPTEARLRERAKGSLGEYAHEFGIDGEAAMDAWIDQALAERDNRVRADERAKTQEMKDYGDRAVHKLNQARFDPRDERAKRPDREQIAFALLASDTSAGHAEYVRENWQDRWGLYLANADAVLALEPEAREEAGSALRIDDDGAHIYWADPVEGCWVAFKRVDCVGEEELPERRLPAPEAREEAELFHDQDGDLWKFTDNGEWFHEEEPGEFRQVLSIDAEDQTLTPVGHAELAPDAEAYDVTDAECGRCGKFAEVHREGWFYDHGNPEACPGSGERPADTHVE